MNTTAAHILIEPTHAVTVTRTTTDFTEDHLDAVIAALADHNAAASATADGTRWSVTFNVEATSVADAALVADTIVDNVADQLELPVSTTASIEAMTFDEQDRQLAKPAKPELVGVSEIAQILGVTRQRVSQLRSRPGFPTPLADLAGGPVYERANIGRFVESWDRTSGRRHKVTAE